MKGFGPSTYGDAFADVYDEWYGDDSEVAAVCDLVAELAEGRPVLELGVGTGRLALALAARGIDVHGLDGSAAMLERLRAKPGGERVAATIGDLGGPYPQGPFGCILCATNTFLALPTRDAQVAALAHAAERLNPGGRVVLEAFVPSPPAERGSVVEVRDLSADRVVLSATVHVPDEQRAMGQFIEISESAGVRLRPWQVRWSFPEELDEMAARAGLVREQRWAGWAREPFDSTSPRHVTVYRKPPGAGLGFATT